MAIKLNAEEAVRDLDRLWQQIIEEEETVILSRPGREDIALIAAGELASLQETAHLLGSPANGLRLLTALRDAREGKGTAMTPDQLRRVVGLRRIFPIIDRLKTRALLRAPRPTPGDSTWGPR